MIVLCFVLCVLDFSDFGFSGFQDFHTISISDFRDFRFFDFSIFRFFDFAESLFIVARLQESSHHRSPSEFGHSFISSSCAVTIHPSIHPFTPPTAHKVAVAVR